MTSTLSSLNLWFVWSLLLVYNTGWQNIFAECGKHDEVLVIWSRDIRGVNKIFTIFGEGANQCIIFLPRLLRTYLNQTQFSKIGSHVWRDQLEVEGETKSPVVTGFMEKCPNLYLPWNVYDTFSRDLLCSPVLLCWGGGW